MTLNISPSSFSRIDKLLLDRSGTDPAAAHARRTARGLQIVIGADVAGSHELQLALFTAVNLGVKCFGRVAVHANPSVWLAPCLPRVVRGSSVADGVVQLGGVPVPSGPRPADEPHLALGDVLTNASTMRITFDGWTAAVGPADQLPRMRERPTCRLACVAAAALAVGEIFSAFAQINLLATRQVVRFSLWAPDHDASVDSGEHAIGELPAALSLFGLGHLGQGYLWALAALPYADPSQVCFWLCDDDLVEKPNIETGALLAPPDAVDPELKTRVMASWLKQRGFLTRLLERRVDAAFRRTEREPVIALSGFDDNWPRQWLTNAGFERVFDSGLGGEAHNFDTISFRAWPNVRSPEDLWPVESEQERLAREARRMARIQANPAYAALADDECGRFNLAGLSVAVPFVGAVAATVVVAELLKCVNGLPTYDELKLRMLLLGSSPAAGRLAPDLPPVRGLRVVAAGADQIFEETEEAGLS